MIADLEAAVLRIESIRVEAVVPHGAAEYSLLDDLLQDPGGELAGLLDRVYRQLKNYSDVSTPAAHTVVAWGGDIKSATVAEAGPESLCNHAAAVAKAVAARTQWLRVLIAATSVAATIAAATTNPAATPAAFRAGWKLAGELKAVLGASAD